ncbi:MAG TPA: twin-arginine translocase subunit TatC [Candidatus Saccharimonadales bacterium]|nr:twin-arginine translocase subunit TatC [Candidatus Saccharimonadales bacterium]
MTRSAKRKKTASNNSRQAAALPEKLPFIEHLHELRRRLFIVAVSVGIWSSLAYGVEHHIVDWLIAPAHGEKFIYTSVGGGIDFLFRVCLYAGVLFSIPVIFYQILRYMQPLLKRTSLKFIINVSLISGLLALAGILFGYYLGLPSALQFLLHQFNGEDISALITIQAYLSFVMLYLFGSSLLFQVPLILYVINRIRPIKPKTLLKYERWVILLSFIIGAMINPSPRIYDMTILALPMIMSYQVGVAIVWWTNRKTKRHGSRRSLLDAEAARRQERYEQALAARHMPVAALKTKQPTPLKAAAPLHVSQPAAIKPVYAAALRPAAHRPTVHRRPPTRPSPAYRAAPITSRSQKYVNGFIDFRPAAPL